MQQVIYDLSQKGVLPQRLIALEMFGMHGFWHTMDYIKYVDSLDFFEIDADYANLAKKISWKIKRFQFTQKTQLNI